MRSIAILVACAAVSFTALPLVAQAQSSTTTTTIQTDANTIWVRPRLAHTGTLWSPRRGLLAAVRGGEEAVTADLLRQVEGWPI